MSTAKSKKRISAAELRAAVTAGMTVEQLELIAQDYPELAWEQLERHAEMAANARMASQYELACKCFSILRNIAEQTGCEHQFDTLLLNFKSKHGTKSLLISRLQRQVKLFDGTRNTDTKQPVKFF